MFSPHYHNQASVRGQTILLVDDDAYFLAWLSTYLEGEGYNVLKASHAQQATALCRRHEGQIDLLLTDLLFPSKVLQLQTSKPAWPRVNGIDLMKQVLELCPEVQVIIMSGHSDQELDALQLSREGRPFLRKPFRLDTLLWTVTALLDDVPTG
jgi:CheY-like chemotaxis protein